MPHVLYQAFLSIFYRGGVMLATLTGLWVQGQERPNVLIAFADDWGGLPGLIKIKDLTVGSIVYSPHHL